MAQPNKNLHKKLYRIYYTAYESSVHEKVKELIREKYGVEPKDIPSNVIPEFRFLEVPLPREGLQKELEELVQTTIGSKYVKVDWIDTEA